MHAGTQDRIKHEWTERKTRRQNTALTSLSLSASRICCAINLTPSRAANTLADNVRGVIFEEPVTKTKSPITREIRPVFMKKKLTGRMSFHFVIVLIGVLENEARLPCCNFKVCRERFAHVQTTGIRILHFTISI